MRIQSTPHPEKRRKKPRQAKRNQSGIAIVTVLSVLLLMSVLMLAFFSGARTELETSRYYAASLRTRQLSDVVTNIVVAQIREATSKSTQGSVRTTWSSQPGLITTFTNRKASRYEQLVAAKYKLYSSAKMLASRQDVLTSEIATDWDEQPERWVDLNEPVYSDLDQNLYFPIVDPRAFRGPQQKNSVEGFTYGLKTSTGVDIAGTVVEASDEDQQRAPMPVEWLYVLDDGTLGYLDNSNKFVSTQGTSRPTKLNPISARIAFWTDDESSKININTASEGVHWDIPRYDSRGEHKFSQYPPAQREYYRYPCHPAMVSLSSVFAPHQDQDERKKVQDMLQVSPKNAWIGSSLAGTTRSSAQNGVDLDEHRLYASVDDIFYRQGDNNQVKPTGDRTRIPNNVFKTTGSNSARSLLEKSRFFLTANSVAPEMTLFGTPRMSMWPLPEASNSYTVYDKLLAYCNNINGARYFWQRRSAGSRHGEVYGRAGDNNIRLLWNYLSPLTADALPGYGRRLGEKYGGSGPGSDTFQIITSCWDTVRTTNLYDPLGVKYNEGGNYGQIASCCLCGGPPSGSNHATGAHRSRWDKNVGFPAKGFGRLFTVSEITMVFIRSGATDAGGQSKATIEVGIVLEVFCPSHGFTKISPNSYISVNGAPTGAFREQESDPIVTIGGQQATLQRNGASTRRRQGGKSRWWGAHGEPTLFSSNAIQFQVGGSTKIPIPTGAQEISVTMGEPWRVIMFDVPNVDINNLIQIANIQWPSGFSVPVPSTSGGESWSQRVASGNSDTLIKTGDVTRSMVVGHGDYRHTMAKRITERGVFRPHFKFTTNENHAHSLTEMDGSKLKGFSVQRDMIPGANYSERLIPDFPNSPSDMPNYAPMARGKGAKFPMDPNITGDWDNGVGMHLDGPYVNRIDDGSSDGSDPYFDVNSISKTTNVSARTFFSPNRLVGGPGQFGSLPTGVRDNIPWRTLLFRPDTEHFGSANQPANGDLPDHLFMDLFWMPVIEPYALSMPFATRGKINLNYQIIPFDNIKRQTALHALMKSERVVAIPTEAGDTYKENNGGDDKWRHKIDAYQTLQQAEDRFAKGEVFRSPTEICELYLVPQDSAVTEVGNQDGRGDYPAMRAFWEKHRLTGDNTKERPYANMQPRLTTKSNVFKVHMIVQTLKKVRSSEVDKFDSDKDKVTGQWRGSAIIERFIDPNDGRIPNYIEGGSPTRKKSLDDFYSFRVLHMKAFAP